MYQYVNGLVIRDGTEGVPAAQVENLFKDAGWARDIPSLAKGKVHTNIPELNLGFYGLGC